MILAVHLSSLFKITEIDMTRVKSTYFKSTIYNFSNNSLNLINSYCLNLICRLLWHQVVTFGGKKWYHKHPRVATLNGWRLKIHCSCSTPADRRVNPKGWFTPPPDTFYTPPPLLNTFLIINQTTCIGVQQILVGSPVILMLCMDL